MDYARLIRHAYTPAADVSNNPQAFARSISYSRYISEVNHWERKEDQCFLGALKIIVENGKLTGINVIHVEDYLTSLKNACPLSTKIFILPSGSR